MAVYKNKFENVYEKDLTSDIDGIETVDVKGKTTFNYTNGLTIDATGQTFYRKAEVVNTKTPNHTLNYQTSETHANMQMGYATFNVQLNVTNVAVAVWKTETSTSYNLAGGIFVNPSPIKLKRTGASIRTHPRVREWHLVLLEKAKRTNKNVTKIHTGLYRLHMWGL